MQDFQCSSSNQRKARQRKPAQTAGIRTEKLFVVNWVDANLAAGAGVFTRLLMSMDEICCLFDPDLDKPER